MVEQAYYPNYKEMVSVYNTLNIHIKKKYTLLRIKAFFYFIIIIIIIIWSTVIKI